MNSMNLKQKKEGSSKRKTSAAKQTSWWYNWLSYNISNIQIKPFKVANATFDINKSNEDWSTQLGGNCNSKCNKSHIVWLVSKVGFSTIVKGIIRSIKSHAKMARRANQ